MMLTALLIGLFFVAYFGSLLYSFAMFDRLVRLEHSQYRTEWDADGQPYGFFFKPHGWLHPYRGTFAFWRVTLAWPLSPPAWALESGAKDLRRLRAGLMTGFSLLALLVLAFVVLAVQ